MTVVVVAIVIWAMMMGNQYSPEFSKFINSDLTQQSKKHVRR